MKTPIESGGNDVESRKCNVGEERTRLPHHQLRRQASGPVRLRDAGGSQSSPNPCPGGGRKSGLSVAVRVLSAVRIQYALETDWLAEAGGFEPSHQEFVSRWLTDVVPCGEWQIVHAPAAGPAHALLPLSAPPNSDRRVGHDS